MTGMVISMRIAICSSDGDCCVQLCEWLTDYARMEKTGLRLFTYHNAGCLYQYMDMGGMWDLILIDVSLPGNEGIELGESIRRHPMGGLAEIIFFSGGTDCCHKLFGVEPLNWHPSPLIRKEIYHDMDKIISCHSGLQKILKYDGDGVICRVPLKEIQYIEALGKVLHVYTKDEAEIIMRDSLNHMEEKYRAYGFCRCHRSYLVNMDYVRACQDGFFILRDGQEIPYGTKYMDEVETAVYKWKKRRETRCWNYYSY